MTTYVSAEYRKRGFIAHLVVYMMVNAGLAAINYTYSPNYLWFLYPVAGWGVGVIMHLLFGVLWQVDEAGETEKVEGSTE